MLLLMRRTKRTPSRDKLGTHLKATAVVALNAYAGTVVVVVVVDVDDEDEVDTETK